MTPRVVGNRTLCGFSARSVRCDRPAVGAAWHSIVKADVPICLPCADRLDVEIAPYRAVSR